ncbi:MAG: sigma-70 family RNA polymerase sigma factor [Candidatus Eisenbacteria bacterium]
MSEESWPAFLDMLESDPKAAFAAFYRLAMATLSLAPPRQMRGLSQEDCQDLIHEVVFHCVRDDFRVLRRYVDMGKPFVAWLYTIAHHKCLDYLRSHDIKVQVVSIHENPEGKGLENVLADPANGPDKRSEDADLVAIVKKAMGQLGERCRLLLEMAADEFMPKEMAAVLGLSPDQNKKISDDLRYCRKRLKQLLSEAGFDMGFFTG